MEVLLNLCRGCAIFVAASGFLFGQLFFGQFELAATLTGTFGLLAAILGLGRAHLGVTRAWVITIASIIALLGVGFDAYDYYSREHSSGNYYAWFLIGPYCAALVLIGAHSMNQVLNKRVGVVEATPNKSVESDT